MERLFFLKATTVLVCVIAGFSAGYFAFDNSVQIQEMRNLIEKLQNINAKNAAVAASAKSFPSDSIVPTLNKHATNASPITTSGKDDPFKNITVEDIEITKAMNKREEAGEYILEFERPFNRKLMQEGIKKFAAELAQKSASEVRGMFTNVGIKPEVAKQFELHQEKIKLAALEAEQAIGQVQMARQEYDKRMQALLSKDEYAQYRQMEETRPATHQYSLLQEYANEHHISIDPAMEKQLTELIKSTKAYTEVAWHNPYDGLPQPEAGINALKCVQNQIKQIIATSTELKARASEMGLHEGYINLLDAFYRDKINRKEFALKKALDTMGWVLEP